MLSSKERVLIRKCACVKNLDLMSSEIVLENFTTSTIHRLEQSSERRLVRGQNFVTILRCFEVRTNESVIIPPGKGIRRFLRG